MRSSLIFCYHGISKTWHHELAVAPRTFVTQIEWMLRRGYVPADLDEICRGLRPAIHVTFDDAFRSILSVVPFLVREGVKTTIFVSTDYAREGRPLLLPELRGSAPEAELETLRWDELRDLHSVGIAIGSHSRTHSHLPTLDDEGLRRELVESRADVEHELSVPCSVFSYPFGEFDERTKKATRAAGYAAALSLDRWRNLDDAYELPRVGIYRRDRRLRYWAKVATHADKTDRLPRRPTARTDAAS
jgi:peptidoglycan/xylan/chitin deacetylase (PgdA/CDA1 family)